MNVSEAYSFLGLSPLAAQAEVTNMVECRLFGAVITNKLSDARTAVRAYAAIAVDRGDIQPAGADKLVADMMASITMLTPILDQALASAEKMHHRKVSDFSRAIDAYERCELAKAKLRQLLHRHARRALKLVRGLSSMLRLTKR